MQVLSVHGNRCLQRSLPKWRIHNGLPCADSIVLSSVTHGLSLGASLLHDNTKTEGGWDRLKG